MNHSKIDIKISVIVTVYNAELYLSSCLDSLIQQTFTDFEVIVVEDCSPDQCGKIADGYIEKFKKSNLQYSVIHNSLNLGVSISRKKALEIAIGKFILIIDGDDTCKKNMLEALYAEASNGGDFIICGYNECFVGEVIPHGISSFENKPRSEVLKDNYGSILNGFWNKLIRKDLIQYAPWVDVENMQPDEEIPIISYCFKAAKSVKFVHMPLYNYRKRSASFTGLESKCMSRTKMLENRLRQRNLIRILQRNGLLNEKLFYQTELENTCSYVPVSIQNDDYFRFQSAREKLIPAFSFIMFSDLFSMRKKFITVVAMLLNRFMFKLLAKIFGLKKNIPEADIKTIFFN